MEKAVRDQYRSFYEAALERNNGNENAPEVRDWKDKAKDEEGKVNQLNLDKQDADAKLADAKARLQVITGREQELQGKIKLMEDNINLIAKRLGQLTSPVVQDVVRLPLIEFAASPFKVEQIEADNHHLDVNFTTVPRVDRCTTCHKSIDRKDPTPEELQWRTQHKIAAIEWSKLPEPLRNHPRLDLFVSDNSPHPVSTYGCTVCHWGWDRETTFSRAGHTPDDETKRSYQFDATRNRWIEVAAETNADAEAAAAGPKKNVVEMTQKAAWEKNYHWEEQEFLLQPMRQAEYIQASCLKCHANETNLKGAEKLDHGRRLIEQLGCWSCHKMRQLETYTTHHVAAGEDFDSICKFYEVDPDEVRKLNSLPPQPTLRVGQDLTIPIRTLSKLGPSLFKVAGKTNKEWVRKWLENPVAFKPNTYMPRFWGLDNNQDTPDRNAVEINAVADFLFAVSEPPQYPAPPVNGDAENGKKLVGQLGCMGCHVVDERLLDHQAACPLGAVHGRVAISAVAFAGPATCRHRQQNDCQLDLRLAEKPQAISSEDKDAQPAVERPGSRRRCGVPGGPAQRQDRPGTASRDQRRYAGPSDAGVSRGVTTGGTGETDAGRPERAEQFARDVFRRLRHDAVLRGRLADGQGGRETQGAAEAVSGRAGRRGRPPGEATRRSLEPRKSQHAGGETEGGFAGLDPKEEHVRGQQTDCPLRLFRLPRHSRV